MSLEKALAENTAALLALTAIMQGTDNTVDLSSAKAYMASVTKAEAKKSAQVPAAASSPTPAETPASVPGADSPKPVAAASPQKATAAASPASAPGATGYDKVKELILAVSKAKGGDAARAVLAGLGVSKGPELKPEQYGAAIQACEAALA